MTDDRKSIVIIADDPAISAEVMAALRSCPDMTVEAYPGTLAMMNGAATRLAASHSVMIFKTESTSDADMAAVAAMRRELDRGAILLALAEPGISLTDARRLTRAGVDEILTRPVNPAEIREQVERLTRPLPLMLVSENPGQVRAPGKVITLAQARGGVGATTVAVNLACRLLDRTGIFRKQTRNKVALVDLDLQFGSVAGFLDLEPRDTFHVLALDEIRPDATFLSQSMALTADGLAVLTAPQRFMPLDAIKPDQIAAILDLLRRDYDYVVVDLPHALVAWLTPVLERTDRMLMVTDSTVPAIRQARRLIDFYTEEAPALQIEMVVNRERRPIITSGALAEASRVLERPFRHWLPDDPGAARAAVDRGAPVASVAGRSGLAKGINALGRSMMTALSDPAPKTGPAVAPNTHSTIARTMVPATSPATLTAR